MHKEQKFMLVLLLLSSAAMPTNSLSMEWVLNWFGSSTKEIPANKHVEPAHFDPIIAANKIQAALVATTKLPDPLLDIVHDYNSTYPFATIDLFDKQFAKYASVNMNPPPIHSIVNIKIDKNNRLAVLLANRTTLTISLPEGNLVNAERDSVPYKLVPNSAPRAITYRKGQAIVNRFICTYFVTQSIINDTASNDLYSARIVDPERGKPEFSEYEGYDEPLQRWHEKDDRYNEEDWLEGRDKRRTSVELSLKVKQALALKKLQKN